MSSENSPGAPAHGHRDTREIEWQLASADLNPVRRWLAAHPQIEGLTLRPDATVEIHDTYFDTDDWRIHRAGYALRIRTEAGKTEATLKALHSARDDVADRREVTEELGTPDSDRDPSGFIRDSDGPVGRRVHAVSGTHALVPLFEVRTSREKFAVSESEDSEPLGEIALDETIICRPGGSPRSTLKRVEVEAHAQSVKPLQSMVKTLRRACRLRAAAQSKYAQGLKSAGLAPRPPASLSPTTVHATMRMDDAVLAGLRRYLADWFAHEPGARLGDDPEELHDLRVSGRRLEALVRQFRAYLPEALVQLGPVLRQVRDVLGEARDLDIGLAGLERFMLYLPGAERAALLPLQQHLAAQRSDARRRMLELLDGEQVQETFAQLTRLLAQPSRSEAGAAMVVDIAPTLVEARYRKLRKGVKALQADSPLTAYHDVRTQVKKLRYTLETVALLYGKPAEEMLRALRRWQDKLGIQQDADVAGQRLRALVTAPDRSREPELLFLMGRLAEHHAAAASRARRSLPKAYRKVRQRWKKLRPLLAIESAPEKSPAVTAADPASPTAATKSARPRAASSPSSTSAATDSPPEHEAAPAAG